MLLLPPIAADWSGAVLTSATAVVSAVIGAALGGWLGHRSATATATGALRAEACRELANLYRLIWPPTRLAELTAGLEVVDALLVASDVSPQLRAALRRAAQECWEDGASRWATAPEGAGISTKLLTAYRQVQLAALLELRPKGRTRNRGRVRSIVRQAEQLIAENAADRNDRFAELPPRRWWDLRRNP